MKPLVKASMDRTVQHSKLVAEIRLALGLEPDLVLWPNPVKHIEGVTKDGTLIHMRTGLCQGSSDLVGLCRGRFIGLEVKTGSARPQPHQTQWAELVRAKGGFAAAVWSVAEARAAVARCREGRSS